MTKFEYKIIPTDDQPPTTNETFVKDYEEFLNNLGFDGWELCSDSQSSMIFKRPCILKELKLGNNDEGI